MVVLLMVTLLLGGAFFEGLYQRHLEEKRQWLLYLQTWRFASLVEAFDTLAEAFRSTTVALADFAESWKKLGGVTS